MSIDRATAYIDLTKVEYIPGILGLPSRVLFYWDSNIEILPEDNFPNPELLSERFIDQSLYTSIPGESPLHGYNLLEHTTKADGPRENTLSYTTTVSASFFSGNMDLSNDIEISLYVVSKVGGIFENRDYVSLISNFGLTGSASINKSNANVNNGYIGFVEKGLYENSIGEINYTITDLAGIQYETINNVFAGGNTGVIINYGGHNVQEDEYWYHGVIDTIVIAIPKNREYSKQIKKYTSHSLDNVYYFNFKKQINSDVEVGGQLPDGTIVNPVPESPDIDFDEDGNGDIPPNEDHEIIVHPPVDLPNPGPNDGDKELDVNVPPGTNVDLDVDYGQEDPDDPTNPDYFYSTIKITARNYNNETVSALINSVPVIVFNNGVAELSEAGAYNITVSAEGYKSESLYVNVKSTGVNFKADVFLIKENSDVEVGGELPDGTIVNPVPESPDIDFDEDGKGEIPPGEDTEIIIHPPVDLPDPGVNDGDKEIDVNLPPGTDVDIDIDYGQEDPEDPTNPDYFYSTITITARNEYNETLSPSINSVPVIVFNNGVAELSEAGAYNITVSVDGYKPKSLYVNVKSTGVNFKADVSLEKILEPEPIEDDDYFLIYQPYFNEQNLNLGE